MGQEPGKPTGGEELRHKTKAGGSQVHQTRTQRLNEQHDRGRIPKEVI